MKLSDRVALVLVAAIGAAGWLVGALIDLIHVNETRIEEVRKTANETAVRVEIYHQGGTEEND